MAHLKISRGKASTKRSEGFGFTGVMFIHTLPLPKDFCYGNGGARNRHEVTLANTLHTILISSLVDSSLNSFAEYVHQHASFK